MSERERGFDDVADLARARGDVVQGASASGEYGEAAFAQTTQASQERVVGAGVDVEDLVASRLFDRGMYADAGAVVAAVGEGRQSSGGCGVQRAQHVLAGGGQVVD
jgi:hypothetical protein